MTWIIWREASRCSIKQTLKTTSATGGDPEDTFIDGNWGMCQLCDGKTDVMAKMAALSSSRSIYTINNVASVFPVTLRTKLMTRERCRWVESKVYLQHEDLRTPMLARLVQRMCFWELLPSGLQCFICAEILEVYHFGAIIRFSDCDSSTV